MSKRPPLKYYLSLQYPLNVLADPEGGYVAVFPDLPGCMTQGETLEELAQMAADARGGWMATEYERGNDIPLPTYTQEHSGRFNLRLPKSLHRSLAEAAEREGVSLNQYVLYLLTMNHSVQAINAWPSAADADKEGSASWAVRLPTSAKPTRRRSAGTRAAGVASP
ncbi:MAG: type II toxin-antitoxin system HicB family antitoxin [Dehalococcoidia bacterium]|nr:type II toxin-antitoxin system HicB family antitoxin [Dehalococcoidia bacterium]